MGGRCCLRLGGRAVYTDGAMMVRVVRFRSYVSSLLWVADLRYVKVKYMSEHRRRDMAHTSRSMIDSTTQVQVCRNESALSPVEKILTYAGITVPNRCLEQMPVMHLALPRVRRTRRIA
jgi:hypothetical protein